MSSGSIRRPRKTLPSSLRGQKAFTRPRSRRSTPRSSRTPPELLLADEWKEDNEGKVYLTEVRFERVKEREGREMAERTAKRAQEARDGIGEIR